VEIAVALAELLETQTPEGSAFTHLQLALFQLNGRLSETLEGLAQLDELTLARCQVMAAIDIAGRPLTVASIARQMGLTRQSVQRTVNAMVKDGLLALEDNPDHKRAPLVRMTHAGDTKAASVRTRHQVWADTLAARLELKQLVAATELLNRLNDVLATDAVPGLEEIRR
jgi:DNA-binding MarR family transcriptional regulator